MSESDGEYRTRNDKLTETLYLKLAVKHQLRRRGIEGDPGKSVVRNGTLYVIVGREEVKIEMTNSIQALLSSVTGGDTNV